MAGKRSPLLKEEYLEAIRRFRPIDDTFMRCMFRDCDEVAETVLRIILGKPDLRIIKSASQADLKGMPGSRSLCLDVFASDSDGRIYDIEVQRDMSGADPRRARYHSSAMDVAVLKSGEEFSQLPDSYVIFITERDSHGRGMPIYMVRRIMLDDGSEFPDGSYIVYANGEYRDGSDIGKLMHDFSCSDPDEMLIPAIAERTRHLKTNDREVRTMCEQMEKIKAEGMKEGIKEGLKKGIKKGIKEGRVAGVAEGMAREARTAAENMKRMGLGYDMIARYLGKDEKQIREILDSSENSI